MQQLQTDSLTRSTKSTSIYVPDTELSLGDLLRGSGSNCEADQASLSAVSFTELNTRVLTCDSITSASQASPSGLALCVCVRSDTKARGLLTDWSHTRLRQLVNQTAVEVWSSATCGLLLLLYNRNVTQECPWYRWIDRFTII